MNISVVEIDTVLEWLFLNFNYLAVTSHTPFSYDSSKPHISIEDISSLLELPIHIFFISVEVHEILADF